MKTMLVCLTSSAIEPGARVRRMYRNGDNRREATEAPPDDWQRIHVMLAKSR
jgi:hypothetical protein